MKDNKQRPEDIVQIIPGSDWRVLHYWDKVVIRTPLVAWGLTRGGDVHALYADSIGYVDLATEVVIFLAIEHVSQPFSPTEIERMISENKLREEELRKKRAEVKS